jgi:hypothetical protein
MNTNIILDGFTAILNQIVATAVAEAIKPLQERIAVLETGEWTKTQHIVVKEIQPLQDRVIALEINQTLVSSAKVDFNEAVRDVVIDTFDVHGQNTLNEAVRNVLDDGDYIVRDDIYGLVRDVLNEFGYIKRNDVVDLVDKVVENAIDAYDFSDSIDWDNKIEEGINNYDFSDIIEENMPDLMSEDTVQGMIDDALGSLVVVRT